MDPEIAKLLGLLGNGGITAALIALIFFVGKSLIASVKEVRDEIKAHTKTDVESHSEVKETVVRLEGKIDAIFDLTPVEHKRPSTPSRGVPAGRYQFGRPGTKDR